MTPRIRSNKGAQASRLCAALSPLRNTVPKQAGRLFSFHSNGAPLP